MTPTSRQRLIDQQAMRAGHRQRTVTDREADALLSRPERMSPAARMPGTVVSRGQGSRSLRGQSPERTTSVPVSRIAVGVASELRRQPLRRVARRRSKTNTAEQGVGLRLVGRLTSLVPQRDRLHPPIAMNRLDLGLLRESPRWPWPEFAATSNPTCGMPQRPTNEQVYLARGTALRQKHDGLSGRVAAARPRRRPSRRKDPPRRSCRA